MSASTAKSGIRSVALLKHDQSDDLLSLESRRTDELVIGLVGPIAAGVSTTADRLRFLLETQFSYTAHIRKMSPYIEKFSPKVDETLPANLSGVDRITRLQDIGNKLRETLGGSFVAEECIQDIAIERESPDGIVEINGISVVKARRIAHIIDSIKNPAEAELFRSVYGDMFWLFAVNAPEKVRRSRITRMYPGAHGLDSLFARDEDEKIGHGQHVRLTIQHADFFIRNDTDRMDHLDDIILKYLDLLFNVNIQTPLIAEAGMYHAVSAGAKSACMSRQVGAAIYSAACELISVGWNDVPKFKGGLYTSDNHYMDKRCFLIQGKICHNDSHKNRLYHDIANRILTIYPELDKARIVTELEKTDVRNLVEFSRAVHAEMEAILAAARDGCRSLVGATMYVTTYPCHNCARHIVASGIEKVVYIEPYPKSLALTLHADSISDDENDAENRVLFLQYQGVTPKNILRLYKHGIARKLDGKIITSDRTNASPVSKPPMDGFSSREQIVVDRLNKKLYPKTAI